MTPQEELEMDLPDSWVGHRPGEINHLEDVASREGYRPTSRTTCAQSVRSLK